MNKSNLCFCVRGDQVLLGMKKRGFGTNKWNGYGGKFDDESPKTATIRELGEESGLIAEESDLEQVALIRFYFDKKPVFECHVFLLKKWQGEPVETEEMRPKWYQTSQLPFAEMWVDDQKWLPLVLTGEKIEAECNFNADGTEVKEFNYKTVVFE